MEKTCACTCHALQTGGSTKALLGKLHKLPFFFFVVSLGKPFLRKCEASHVRVTRTLITKTWPNRKLLKPATCYKRNKSKADLTVEN